MYLYLLTSHFPCEIKVSESFNSSIHHAMSLVLLCSIILRLCVQCFGTGFREIPAY